MAGRERARELRQAAEAIEAAAEAAQREQGFEVMNRSDDFVMRPASEDLVMVTTSAGLMPLWKARAMCIGYTQAHLRADEAPDRFAVEGEVRNGADRDERAMGLEEDCSDCNEEKRSDKALEIARAIAHRDEDIDSEPAPKADDTDDRTKILALVERTIERVNPLLTELAELRSIVKDQQQQIEALIGVLRERIGNDEEKSAEEPPPMLN
jgi:hypothetical protein